MKLNPLQKLATLGQSIWLDYIERDLVRKGGLKALIENDHVAGVTSNPSIFQQAITRTGQYDAAISALADAGAESDEIYQHLVIDDIRRAADVLKPVYERTGGEDGYVSLEVSPHLAHDTKASIEQARWLWKQVARPNLMVKIPGTLAGLPAITQLISEGININVTLLFSIKRYKEVFSAYVQGLENRVGEKQPINNLASVASFFLSRIDTAVDAELEALPEGDRLQSQTAIACAKMAYQSYLEMIGNDRWQALSKRGARKQRLLWASTSTKNPALSDVMYVDTLIGPGTVNTLPPATLEAYRDHGAPTLSLETGLPAAVKHLNHIESAGVDLSAIARQLENEGVDKFVASFDSLMSALDTERKRLRTA